MTEKNLKIAKIDKRQLFFDRNKKIYIEFDLEKTRTCSEIYNSFQTQIEEKISEIYNNNNNNKVKCNFILMYSSSTSKLDNTSLIEIKLDLDTQLSDIMPNKHYFLCYMPMNKLDLIKKRKVRNKLEEEDVSNNRFKDVEREKTDKHEIEKYLTNEGVYYFDKEKVNFIYGKGYIDEQKLVINYKNNNVEISISEIKREEYYENSTPPSIQVFKIKYPNYIIQIYQNNLSHFLGLYKLKSYLIWRNAIELAKIKNTNVNVDSSFNTNIFNYNYLLFVKSHSIPSKSFIINQILENPEKRKIFLDKCEDKKISDIASNIFSYKINIKNEQYIEAWSIFKQIIFYVDYNSIQDDKIRKNEAEKHSKVCTPERIELYNNILKKVDEAIKSISDYEKEVNDVLKRNFQYEIFDDLYYNIYELYLLPHFKNVRTILNTEYDYDQKPPIVKKFHLLLSKYCKIFFEMKNVDKCYYYLKSDSNDDKEEEISGNNSTNNIINIAESNLKTNKKESSNNNEINGIIDNNSGENMTNNNVNIESISSKEENT